MITVRSGPLVTKIRLVIQTVVGFGSVTGRARAAGVPEALVGVKTWGAALGLGRQEGEVKKPWSPVSGVTEPLPSVFST